MGRWQTRVEPEGSHKPWPEGRFFGLPFPEDILKKKADYPDFLFLHLVSFLVHSLNRTGKSFFPVLWPKPKANT